MVHLAKQQELQDTYNLDVPEASNEFNDTPDQISEGMNPSCMEENLLPIHH